MIQNIEEDTCKFILKSVVQVEGNVRREKTTEFGGAKHIPAEDGKEKVRPKPIVKGDQVGRNDDCPYGSGKKFKSCRGK